MLQNVTVVVFVVVVVVVVVVIALFFENVTGSRCDKWT